jgi:hypothetical protein
MSLYRSLLFLTGLLLLAYTADRCLTSPWRHPAPQPRPLLNHTPGEQAPRPPSENGLEVAPPAGLVLDAGVSSDGVGTAGLSPSETTPPSSIPASPSPVAKPTPVPPVESPAPRVAWTEEELRRQLQSLPEVQLPGVEGVRTALLGYAAATAPVKVPVLTMTANGHVKKTHTYQPASSGDIEREQANAARSALLLQAQHAGLPLRALSECQLNFNAARFMNDLSAEIRKVRRDRIPGVSFGAEADLHGVAPLQEMLDIIRKHPSIRQQGCDMVPTLVQMLQVEGEPIRKVLIEELRLLPRRTVTEALARRAVFDLSADLRRLAVEALVQRPRDEYEPVLLTALRYPWAPAADHAAEALVGLHDTQAVPQLRKLLDLPDPTVPVFNRKTYQWEVREVVAINHLSNCCLCHAPSYSTEDVLRGRVPEPGKPLPSGYYKDKRGPFVRADITHLKQDFSVLQPVTSPRPWPHWQRFDYLVRTRRLSQPPALTRTRDPAGPQASVTYPQREAVQYALRSLTGTTVRPSATAASQPLTGTTMEGASISLPGIP